MGLFKNIFTAVRNIFSGQPTTSVSEPSEPSYEPSTSQQSTAARHRDIDNFIDGIAERALLETSREMKKRAKKWAEETAAEFRAVVPVDTGNLMKSIRVLSFEATKEHIYAEVGVDKRKILPPPRRMRRRNGKMRTMPNYDYSPYILGKTGISEDMAIYTESDIGDFNNSVYKEFSRIAKKNAEKIVFKK